MASVSGRVQVASSDGASNRRALLPRIVTGRMGHPLRLERSASHARLDKCSVKVALGHNVEIGRRGTTLQPNSAIDVIDHMCLVACWCPKAAPGSVPADTLERCLKGGIAKPPRAAVKVVALQSWGEDLSLVRIPTQWESRTAVYVCPLGFREPGDDQAPCAHAIGQHLPTTHSKTYVSGTAALAVIIRLGRIFDEVFADTSFGPARMVVDVTHRARTLCLPGKDSEMLFSGNNHYFLELGGARVAGLPRRVRSEGAAEPCWLPDQLSQHGNGNRTDRLTHPAPGAAVGRILELRRPFASAALRSALWTALADLLAHHESDIASTLETRTHRLTGSHPHKRDRTSKPLSRGVRAEPLDHRRMADFVLPTRREINVRWKRTPTKWTLRTLMDRSISTRLRHRPKPGFAVPLRAGLSGSLRCWTDHRLGDGASSAPNVFPAQNAQVCPHKHAGGAAEQSSEGWPVSRFHPRYSGCHSAQEWLQEVVA